MGTRGCYGFLIDGEEKVTYNHFDSYPSYLGVHILDFLKTANLDELPEVVRNIQLVHIDKKPTDTAKKICKDMDLFDGSVSGKSGDDWYCLMRNAQGDISLYMQGLPYMIDSKSFLVDSLFCEWAYIINFDTKELEIYEGFNQDSKAAGRYASYFDQKQKEYRSDDEIYYGVKLILTIPFEQVKTMTKEMFIDSINDVCSPEE